MPQSTFAITEDLMESKAVKVSQVMRLETRDDGNIAKSKCQTYADMD